MELLKSSIAAFNQTTSTTTLATILLNDLQAFNDSSECREVTRLHDIGLQCEFARVVDDCYDGNKIDYLRLTYCVLESQFTATMLFIVMLAFLFLAIGTTADDFLCPLLVSISKSLKLSDNIAGVTFLAFGNGAPDIFSSIIGIGNSDPSMVIGQLYGGGIFVTTIVVGSILIRERFQIMHRPLLRDIIFYILTTTLVWITFLSERISLINSLCFIVIYLIYVIVVVTSGIVYRRTQVIKDQEVENGGMSIFTKKNAQMPRDRLKRGKKYRIQDGGSESANFDRQVSSESKSSALSLRALFIPENSDNFEGVVLRRIKFRHYPHDPLYERRLTAYNLPSLSELSLEKPDLVLALEPAYTAKYTTANYGAIGSSNEDSAKMQISCQTHRHVSIGPTVSLTHSGSPSDDLHVNHNRANEGEDADPNNNNEEDAIDLEYEKPANDELVIDAKSLVHRRMTISDPSFPSVPKYYSNSNKPTSSLGVGKQSPFASLSTADKFTVARFFSNLRTGLLRLCAGAAPSAKSPPGRGVVTINQSDTDNPEPQIKSKVITELNSVSYGKVSPTSANNKGTSDSDHVYEDEEGHSDHHLAWWKLLIQILLQIAHFDVPEFQESSILGKVLMIVKAPIYLVFTVTIPVVDLELPQNGWNKSLILLQLILSPQCCLLVTELTIAPLSRLQIHLLVLAISSVIAPIVALSSAPKQAPSYHIAFAYFGFAIAISWIYTIANEVVSLLKAIGVIFNLSQFMLGLTFLAWGNSIGDFISNLTMARNGFPRMAISACFGGPVLNMLLGIGIPYTFLLLKQQQSMPSIELVYSRMISIMYGTITCSLLITIAVLLITKFASAQFHGVILVLLYFTFIASAVFTEIKNLS